MTSSLLLQEVTVLLALQLTPEAALTPTDVNPISAEVIQVRDAYPPILVCTLTTLRAFADRPRQRREPYPVRAISSMSQGISTAPFDQIRPS